MNAAHHDDGRTLEARYRQARQQVEDYEQLIQALQTIGAALDVEVVLRQMLDAALRLSQAQQGSLTLLDPAPEHDARTLLRGGSSEGRVLDHYLNLLLSGWMQRHKRPLLTDNLAETFGAPQIPAKYRAVTSALSVPLRQGDTVIGVINLISLNPEHHFTEREAHLLGLLAVQCGHLVVNARLHEALFAETSRLRREVMERYALQGIIGHSPAMQQLFLLLERVLPTEGRVLLEGESGTGKELIARILHFGGPRKDGPFIAIDCGALPANLLESELFGYVKGAFTGAVQNKKGLFEEAHRGTLFLDEIANMPWEIQAKLLRAIQEGEFRPLGATQVKKVDARIIAATSQSLRRQVDAGTFRSDLFYRLNVVHVVVPPLRARTTDLPPLAQHFLKKVAGAYQKPITGFQPETLSLMEQHHWPGNVRELENVVERMVILAEPTRSLLSPDLLPPEILGKEPVHSETASPDPADLKTRLERFEKRTLVDVLAGVDWNQSAAARALGLSESTLRYKLQKLGIHRPDDSSDAFPA